MKFLQHIPTWLKSKYFIATAAFVVWMFFFDRNDITLQWHRINELSTLQQSENDISSKISATKKELDLLKTSPSTLEKYAREKYMMKRDNEDLYIIAPQNENVK